MCARDLKGSNVLILIIFYSSIILIYYSIFISTIFLYYFHNNRFNINNILLEIVRVGLKNSGSITTKAESSRENRDVFRSKHLIRTSGTRRGKSYCRIRNELPCSTV